MWEFFVCACIVIVMTSAVDLVEFYLSKAELAYGKGEVEIAIEAAQIAISLLKHSPNKEREVALKLFVARAKSGQGEFEESNEIYRGLIDEDVYLPPIILGILHNNLRLEKDEKSEKNLGLMRILI